MLSKSKSAWVRSLSQLKFRREYGQFVVEGPKLLAEMLKGPLAPEEIFALPSWISSHQEFLSIAKVTEIDQPDLEKISNLSTPNEVVAVFKIPAFQPFNENGISGLVLALDAIRDPGNLGTIIRTADWFGISTLLLSKDCVDPWNPKVVQASMGSLNSVKIYELDLPLILRSLKGKFAILGAAMHGIDLNSASLPKDSVLVIGSESHGISDEVMRIIDQQITILPSPSAAGESLNASIATAIICSEWARQHPKRL